MRTATKFLALAGLVIGVGGEVSAQAPGPRRMPGNVTSILNARRQLDLTTRQVAQLDSIERGLHVERQRVAERNRPAMDSLRQRDSVATAAADRLLTDTQRTKWREMQAERRGYVRGMSHGRGREPGMQGRQGHRP